MVHSIGELSRQSGVHIETIRYYEKIGLFPCPSRTAGRHRLYADDHMKRLTFIKRGRKLGFTLDEIRNLLGLIEGGSTCGEVKEAALTHLNDIRRKIADLRRMERVLADAAKHCEGGAAAGCPIVNVLSDAKGRSI